MTKYALIFASFFLACPGAHAVAKCSRANLNKCLDSVCAINFSSNPLARCQYCGTSEAGTPPASGKKGMRNVSVGASSKYTISEKELKNAPSEPGQRYVWARTECMKKVAGCTDEDIEESYDSLIEQSCAAAKVSMDRAEKLDELAKAESKSKSSCESLITQCMLLDKACTADYRNCKENSDFDKFFASCSIENTGCDEHISAIRETLLAARDTAVNSAEDALQHIVAAYQNKRLTLLNDAKNSCKDNRAYNRCVATVCANNMTFKCERATDEYPEHADKIFNSENAAAAALCGFYKAACATIDSWTAKTISKQQKTEEFNIQTENRVKELIKQSEKK